MIDHVAALRAVVAALESVDAPYVVVGSGAAAAWGVTRSTRDVDLVTIVTEHEPLLDALADDDLFVPVEQARAWAPALGVERDLGDLLGDT